MADQQACAHGSVRFPAKELATTAASAWQRVRRGMVVLSRDESGSDLIEVALVLPVFFLLIFGIISFAILLFAYCNATFATRIAVRYAVVHSSTSLSPCNAATLQGIVNPWLWGAPSGGVVVTSLWNSGNTIGNVVSVTVQMTYTNYLPYINLKPIVVHVTSQGVILH